MRTSRSSSTGAVPDNEDASSMKTLAQSHDRGMRSNSDPVARYASTTNLLTATSDISHTAVTMPLAPVPEQALHITRWQASKDISKLAWPMLLSFTFSFMVVVIALMASRLEDGKYLGPASLAATYINTVALILVSVFFPVGSTIRSMVSQLKSAEEDVERMKQILYRGGQLTEKEIKTFAELQGEHGTSGKIKELTASITSSVKNMVPIVLVEGTIGFFVLWYSQAIFETVFRQSHETAVAAGSLVQPYSWGMPCLLFRMAFEQALFGLQKQVIAMFSGLLGFAVGTLIAIHLCFNKGMKLAGIGLGYAIEAAITGFLFAMCLVFGKGASDFKFFTDFTASAKDIKQTVGFLKDGLPVVVTNGAEVLAILVANAFAGSLGDVALAAYAYGAQLTFLALIPILGYVFASFQQMAGYLGINQYYNTYISAQSGAISAIAVIFPLCFLAAIYPDFLAFLIVGAETSPEIMEMARVVVRITAAGIMCDAFRNAALYQRRVISAVEQGKKAKKEDITGISIENPMIPSALSIASLWIGVGLAYGLGNHTEMGVAGVSAGLNLGFALGAAALLPGWIRKTKFYATYQGPLHASEGTPLLGDHSINGESPSRTSSEASAPARTWANCFGCASPSPSPA